MNSNLRKKVTLAGLLVSIGIVYGDIGTSPLYVMKAIVNENGELPMLAANILLVPSHLFFGRLHF